jgi:hypothetical protein
MRRSVLLVIASCLALVACFALVGYVYERPTILRVAVVRDSSDQAILAAANSNFGHQHESLRVHTVAVDSLLDSAAALEDGRVDLAVVRSDVSLPPSGQTVLIMRHNAGILMAPGGSPLRSVEDFRDHKIGILRGPGTNGTANQSLLEIILAQYDVAPRAVTMVNVGLADLTKAFETEQIEAVLLVGVPGTTPLLDAVTAVTAAGHGAPVFIPVSEAKGISQRSPSFEATEIVRGVFGGAVPKPAASFDTLGMTTRLVARDTLGSDCVSTLTKLLLGARPTLARNLPLANWIAAPEADKGAALPVHPGTLAYLGDDEQTFFDKYSDAIYIGAMLLSALGSAAAAAAGRLNRSKSVDVDAHFVRLHALVGDIRQAHDLDEIDRLETEADALVAIILGPQAVGLLDASRVAAVGIVLDHIRSAIADRRQMLPAAPRTPFEPRLVGEAPS